MVLCNSHSSRVFDFDMKVCEINPLLENIKNVLFLSKMFLDYVSPSANRT